MMDGKIKPRFDECGIEEFKFLVSFPKSSPNMILAGSLKAANKFGFTISV